MEANKVLNKYFEMRDNSHISHLQTKNYGNHKVLNKFYDNILDLADEFAEQYQGYTGETITNVGSVQMFEGIDIVVYLKECIEYFEDIHKDCSMVTVKITIESTLQEISKTLYLLSLTN